MGTRGSRRWMRAVAATATLVVVLAACSSSKPAATTGSTTGSTPRPLRILVTNDDGFAAPGIDAVVQGLRTLADVQVTVVAPLKNQSGSGGKTTPGKLTVTDEKTASGYPAKAVAGYPADTIRWAIDEHGLSQRPDVVVSGVNFGQNIGPAVNISGTIGAARAAASRGIPALAASAGFPPAGVTKPNFAGAVTQVEKWITQNQAGLLAGTDTSPILLQNLNVPTCAPGTSVRGPVNVPVEADAPLSSINSVNCASTAVNPNGDVQAFNEGFEPFSNLTVTP
jgi:5'-nucleotidase